MIQGKHYQDHVPNGIGRKIDFVIKIKVEEDLIFLYIFY